MDDRLRAMHDVLLAAYREMTRRTPGGRIDERVGVLLAASRHPTPSIVNAALPIVDMVDPAAAIPAIEAFFGGIGHRFEIWTRRHLDERFDSDLAAAGYRELLSLPAMVLANRPEVVVPDGVVLERVADAASHRRWRDAVLAGFAEDSETDRDAVNSAFGDERSLIGAPLAAYVASVDGHPAAAALSHTEHGAGFIGWVGTEPSFRRRGLGALVTAAATTASFDAGARLVTLQASAQGEPVYRRLGFETIGIYRLWGR